MASLSQDPKSGVYRILFRFGGKQYHKSLKTTDFKNADTHKGHIEETLKAIERGWLTLPPGADFWAFVFSGGRLEAKPALADVLTLGGLFARYEEQMPAGVMGPNSFDTYKLHKKHLLRVLGEKRPAQALTTADLQGYANKRAKETYRDKVITASTIKKEVDTFRAVWREAVLHKRLRGDAPTRGLKYEKGEAKLPFITWGEIERRIKRGGLTEEQIKELWDALYLDREQVRDLLAYVRQNASFPFIYPMFVFVAHTGARRSEMMRSQVEDLDFEAGQVCIREKKKDRSVKLTFRHVPMSPLFRKVMQEWLQAGHPGGQHTFCQMSTRMKRREEPEPLTTDRASHHFKQSLEGGKWEVIRGFHVFRHSFASNLAAEGTDQRLIDEWMGHQTEEMRKRYRHLFPKKMEEAFLKVFGE